MPLLTPPGLVRIPSEAPYVFLMGPIQGTSDWQNPTAQWFLEKIPNAYVASPRSEMWSQEMSKREKNNLYQEQLDWEHYNIEEALLRMLRRNRGAGSVVVWCAREEVHIPNRAYAQTTRFEIANLLGFMNALRNTLPFTGGWFLGGSKVSEREHLKGIHIGADEAFPGRRYLQLTLANFQQPLYSSLEETRNEALKYLRNQAQ